jgi:hypothetical protein
MTFLLTLIRRLLEPVSLEELITALSGDDETQEDLLHD